MKTQKTPIRIMRTTMASAIAAIPLLLSQQADAQFTYTGGTLNVNQTYDGLGVDSALNPLTIGGAGVNNYIGDGSGVTGSITVQSGTLTINGNDMKIGQIPWGGVVSTGTVSVALGATLNINQIGQWGGGVGQRGVGIINIASGATLNWQTSGSIEQRFMFGNGPGGLGILNLNGGTLYNYFDPAQALNDDSRQFRVGSDSGAAIVNLNSGTWAMAGEVPFVLGATYTGMNSTPVLTQSATVSVINILNGSLIMSNACPVLDPNKASFVVGDNDFVNFIAGGTGYLSLTNWSLSDYQTLVDAGQIRVNSNTVTIASFAFSTDANGQGILKLSDPVATTPVISPTNTIYSGETVILSESAFGTAPFTYQWQSDNGSGGATFTDISGAVFASYTNNTTGFAVNSYQYRVIVTNALNATITSAPATLTVNAASAPFIVSDTAPATAVSRYQGGTITFTAAFDGNHPMTYQWQLDGNTGTFTNIPGANSATLTITNLQYTQAGNYRLAATNSVGDFASTPTALTVLNPAALQFTWSAPVSMNNLTANQILTNTLGGAQGVVGGAVFGNTAPVIVTLAGGRTITFKNDSSIADSTGNGPAIGAFPGDTTNTTGNANFDSVLNQFKYDNGSHTITINGLIPGEHYSVQLFALDDRTFGTNRLTYFQDGDDAAISVETSKSVAMGDNAYIVGTFYASNSTETITQVLPTGGAGNINALVLRALSFAPASAPIVLTPPASKSVFPGRSATFNVVVDSYVTPHYQWQTNGVDVSNGGVFSGVNTDTLTLADVSGKDGYQISCVVTNPVGSATAGPAILTVLPIPAASGSAGTGVLAQNPIAYWPLNETFDPSAGGMPVYNAVSTADGTYRPSAQNASSGNYGPQAADGFAQFAANQGSVRVTTGADSWVTTPALNFNTNTATISCWVNPDIIEPAFTALLMNRNSGSVGGLHLRDNNELGFTWVLDNNTQWGHSTGLYLPVNTWSFVAMVITPTNTTWYLYNTNGAQTHVYTINNPVMPWSGSETNITIGKDVNNAGRVFTGRIDEVAVFNRSLSSTEVYSLVDSVNPVVVTQPQSQTLGVLSPAQFSVGVSSLSAVTYQWKTNGVNVSNGGVFSGATSSTLSISSIASLNGVVFSCAVTNTGGYAISAGATLTVVTPLGANEYWDINDATPGAGSAAPAGVWDTITPFWTVDSTGSSTATLWANGNTANFSAGTDATGQFNVTVTNTGVGINNLTQTSGRIRFMGGPIALLNSSAVITATTRVGGDYDLRFDSDITGSGSIIKQGAGILHLLANKSFSGGIVLNAGTLALENTTGNPGTGPITLNGGNFVRNWNTVTVTNTINVGGLVNVAGIQNGNDFIIAGPLLATSASANFSVSNIAVNGFNPAGSSIKVSGDISGYTGTFTDVPGNNRLRFGPTSGSGAIVINGANAKFATYGSTSSGNPIDLPDNYYGTFKMGELSGTGGIVRGGWPTGVTTFEIGYLNTTVTYAGALTDNGSGKSAVTKVGTGTLTLSGPCNYSGLTTISNGTLRINAAFLKATTNVIIAAPGKLDLNFTGTNTVNALFIAGVAKAPGTYGATGSSAVNIDDVHFAGTGVLNVTTGPVVPTSAPLTASISGGVLSLSWPDGQGWTLQVQTNSLAVGLSTNWTTLVPSSAGVSSTNITIDQTKPTVFYRLVYP